MKKLLFTLVLVLSFSFSAHADIAVLERHATNGNIIGDVAANNYLDSNGNALTEQAISEIPTNGYSKTGLTADGNTRLIIRYQSDEAGKVSFSLSPSIAGAVLERLTTREIINAASEIELVNVNGKYQASIVFTAPETWPANMNFPKDSFSITASFTSSNGATNSETVNLSLNAPVVVLIHGLFNNVTNTFGYDNPEEQSGIWWTLKNSGLTVKGWNYDGKKGPKTIISSKSNGLAKTLEDALNELNAQGIASTRADIVAHSMGGLMARQFLRTDFDTGNKSDLSYKQGMIRRVVTIAAPNRGSSWGSYFTGQYESLGSKWQSWSAHSIWETFMTVLRNFAYQPGDASDAMQDVAINSSLISKLSYPVPFHSIYGKIKADYDKVNQMIDDIKSQDVVAIKGLDWLPKQFVDTLTSSNGVYISIALNTLGEQLDIKNFLDNFFDGQDNDLCVSEPSAVDIFPANATTSFTGMGKYNHIMISKQNDVAEKILELLQGSTNNFMTPTVSQSEANLDAAFDEYVSGFENYIAAADDDLSEYFDDSLSMNIANPNPEYLGSEGDDPQDQTARISGASDKAFDKTIFVSLEDNFGNAKFFTLSADEKAEFSKSLWFSPTETGIWKISYSTVQDDKLKVSKPQQLIVSPLVYEITGLELPTSKIYLHAGESVNVDLLATSKSGNSSRTYNIAAPAYNIAKWSVSDSSIAKISDNGEITGLKVGRTVFTANVGDFSENLTVEVIPTEVSPSNNNNNILGSSGSGCNSGVSALGLLFALYALKFRKK